MKLERIQDLRALESPLFEAVQEAANEQDTALGVGIDPRTLDCKACTRAEAQREGMEWCDTPPLIDGTEPSYDTVAAYDFYEKKLPREQQAYVICFN